jgi:Fe-S-cluster containining protein
MKTTIYKGKKYKLVGRCNKCGRCCLGKIAYALNKTTRTCVPIKLENPELSTKYSLCRGFDVKNHTCRIYKQRPKFCRDFPTLYKELELLPWCSYRWEYIGETDSPDTAMVYKKGDLVIKKRKARRRR